MNDYLQKISFWVVVCGLSMNMDETVFMTFGTYKDKVLLDQDVKIGQRTSARVVKCKYLCTIFDYFMKWNKHIEYIIKNQNICYLFSLIFLNVCKQKHSC